MGVGKQEDRNERLVQLTQVYWDMFHRITTGCVSGSYLLYSFCPACGPRAQSTAQSTITCADPGWRHLIPLPSQLDRLASVKCTVLIDHGLYVQLEGMQVWRLRTASFEGYRASDAGQTRGLRWTSETWAWSSELCVAVFLAAALRI